MASSTQKVELEDLLNDLEGRVAGVLSRFFNKKKKHLRIVTANQVPDWVGDEEMVEIAIATNALLFQLASLLVLLHRKTGSDLSDIIKLETKDLQRFAEIAKRLDDKPDLTDVSIN